MNSIEQAVYELVKDNIRLKEPLKWFYQRLMSLVPGRKVETNLELIERRGAFFGFHDKSPWSEDGNLLIGHTFTGRGDEEIWKDGRPVDISVFYGTNWQEQMRITRTRAWNWQQGSQLQWFGDGCSIIFNDFREGACVAVSVDVESQKERVFEYPIAAVAPSGERYASVCFKTFGRALPSYGYTFEGNGAISTVAPCELIIKEIDSAKEVVIRLTDLDSHLDPCTDSEGTDFFSHCLFSPDGDKLLFLRRQSLPNRRLRSEMFIVDLESSEIRRVAFNNMVSHYTWLGNDKIFAYANTENGGDGFFVADIHGDVVENWTSKFNNSDGHPHATPSGDRIVSDMYADRSRYQRLFYWKKSSSEASVIAKLRSPMRFWGPCRVDLHPRIRSDGRYVSFDASYSGVRSLVTAELPL